MNEAGVGRVLPASLHQGIADLLPSRLEFYEEWLNPKAMRDGRIGLAPLAAVLSFLRREGEAYQSVSTRAGEYAAEWTYADLSPARRAVMRGAPIWARLRLASRLMERMAVSTYRDCHIKVRWNKQAGVAELTGSLFCVVREPTEQVLCEYYASALRRLLELASLQADVIAERCRANGAQQCRMTLTVRSQ
jgi:hypothetical protein